MLVILTNGCCQDTNETLEAIVEASKLPISLLVVGIGDANFSAMDWLDGSKPMTYKGKKASRNIVNFVSVKSFLNRGNEAIELDLAKVALRDIPQQFLEWAKAENVVPKVK